MSSLTYPCAAGLQPSRSGGTHRVPLALRHPRRGSHGTHHAHLSSQKPSRCVGEGCRRTGSRTCGCVREETWYPQGLWRSWLVPKCVGLHTSSVAACRLQLKNCWMTPKSMSCITLSVACSLISKEAKATQAVSSHSCPMVFTMSGL